jgi:NAD(P)-dependent dehydrogenase (short-subunit alcohol dehydrogenase family)
MDILVNNAGINRPAAGLEVSESEWIDHFNTNLKGGF